MFSAKNFYIAFINHRTRLKTDHSKHTKPGLALPLLSRAIVRTLLYFDIFNYPLNEKEIINSLSERADNDVDINQEIKLLLQNNLIDEKDGFYFIGQEKGKVARRLDGNLLAEKFLKKAYKYSKIIGFFPFVRGVYISGSLSKGFIDKESDIDYFIITEPGRLWLTRFMLTLFKKTFLLNSRKYFCVNYFVDTNSLEIPDKNIFTATELTHLIPTYNYNLYLEILNANNWIKEYYPNFPMRCNKDVISPSKNIITKACETALKGKAGEKLDAKCFKLTLSFWRRKFKDFDESILDLELRSRKNVSKHHPQGYQGKVLTKYKEKIEAFEVEKNVKLSY